MLFVSLIFLFLFLPSVLIVYYSLIRWRKVQNIFLFFSSLFFYAWGEPKFSLILLISILINWLLALLIDKSKYSFLEKTFLIFDILFNLSLLFYYKYIDFTIYQINSLFATNFTLTKVLLPIGISFFTFQAISYVIDVYKGKKDKTICAQINPINVGLYIAFFPQLIAGPIVRYNTFEQQIYDRKESLALFNNGVIRFMVGFSKKILLANSIGAIADRIFAYNPSELSVSLAWLGAISYTFQIYFDFSGYSDMAIGLAKMFGFNFEENFNLPYKAISIREFWKRWHISLSSWFKDYVYIPLGGSNCSRLKNLFNLFIVWLLTGIWHGANYTFVIWGLFYFVLLLLEKIFIYKSSLYDVRHDNQLFNNEYYCNQNRHCEALKEPWQSKTLNLFKHIYVLLCVILAWVLFRSPNLLFAKDFIKAMFYNSNIWSFFTWVLIKENIFFFIFSLLLSFYSFKNILELNNWKSDCIKLFILICFLISIVYLINNTYNPFIYFNF